MNVGVPKETYPGERRVAIVPVVVSALKKIGLDTIVETGAGVEAGFPDAAYVQQGATVGPRTAAFEADIIAQVRTPGANPLHGSADIARLRTGHVLIGFANPLNEPEAAQQIAGTGASLVAMELIPRITRAQNMDALSSMATVAGYKAVLIAANTLPRMFPMLNTAAGTVSPAKVFVMGAGVAGLQAIATARRLGARVSAYDVRPAVSEQVQSLGARFVEVPLEVGAVQDAGGYARAQDEAFIARQQQLLSTTITESDVVITTAAVPGGRAPILVTGAMVAGMQPGSVIVDLAAERGGNCELTEPDAVIVRHGVTILGPTNLVSDVPYHASQMYARNVAALVQHLVRRDAGPDAALRLVLDADDEITKAVLVTHGGAVVHPQVRQLQEAG
jgi:NAD(P) transhydrogenase subunit alpha